MTSFPLDGMRVLVMEDEFLIALEVEQLCRDNGAAEVVIVSNLDALGPDPFALEPHVAVLDLLLEGRTTTGVANQLLERDIPFVFATGYTKDEAMLEGFEGIPLVGKPFSGSDLLNALSDAIRGTPPQSGGV